jgi:hypothetical protein
MIAFSRWLWLKRFSWGVILQFIPFLVSLWIFKVNVQFSTCCRWQGYRRLFGMSFIVLMAACTPVVPAKTPPQLQHTPGVFVVIHERLIEAAGFRVAYPAGWRVVKSSIAAHPVSFVLISPDDTILIEWRIAADECVQGTPVPEKLTRANAFQMGEQQWICISGTAPPDQEAVFLAAWEQVTASIVKN